MVLHKGPVLDLYAIEPASKENRLPEQNIQKLQFTLCLL